MNATRAVIFIYGILVIINPVFAAEVTVVPSAKIVMPGESFDLKVSIDPNGTGIAGAQLNIAFDKSIIKVNSIAEGDLFIQSGANTFFSAGIINNSGGTVINIFDAIMGRKSVLDKGTFIIINATAASMSGTGKIDLLGVKISGPDGLPVALNTASESIRINRPPALSLTPADGSVFNEKESIHINVAASDPDSDPLSYLVKIDGVQVAAAPSYTWKTNYQSSGDHIIEVHVSDGMTAVRASAAISIGEVRPGKSPKNVKFEYNLNIHEKIKLQLKADKRTINTSGQN